MGHFLSCVKSAALSPMRFRDYVFIVSQVQITGKLGPCPTWQKSRYFYKKSAVIKWTFFRVMSRQRAGYSMEFEAVTLSADARSSQGLSPNSESQSGVTHSCCSSLPKTVQSHWATRYPRDIWAADSAETEGNQSESVCKVVILVFWIDLNLAFFTFIQLSNKHYTWNKSSKGWHIMKIIF